MTDMFKTDAMKLRDREPRQGEQFTEPKIGGLYPLVATFLTGLILGGVAYAVFLV